MSDEWYTFRCKVPKQVLDLLETELERIRLLADIDPEDRLSQEVRDGLCLEYLCVNSMIMPDESVV